MKGGTVVMAFSLDPKAAAYVNGAGQGRRSALVRRAIHAEMTRQQVLDDKDYREIWTKGAQEDSGPEAVYSLAQIVKSRDVLQEQLLLANEKIETLERHLRVKKTLTPQGGGPKNRSRVNVLANAFQLLKDRLLFRNRH